MIPHWLTILSIAMLSLGGACAVWIALDILAGHRQHMWIMNIVWPVSALYGTIPCVYFYYRYGRLATRRLAMEAKQRGDEPPSKRLTPFPVMVAKGATHCGSGCTLGDIAAEFLALGAPVVAVWLGWKWLFPPTHHGKIFAVWILDYLFAFAFGIAFQYFTIKPMRDLSVKEGLKQAVKADVLSLTAWQIGMYGFMALAHFVVFVHVWEASVKPDSWVFWFTMQLAMLTGFATAYPVNVWLMRKGVKEKM